jgi:prepilin-type N-terminal cleavage/methylation domain-containing protein
MQAINKSKSRGFTIIEVVLVLAIAGLIFLMVFLALPALQRSQRDTQRKNDIARFMSQLVNYQSNNQGTVPTTQAALTAFVTGYLTNNSQTFNDPSTNGTYTTTYVASTGTAASTNLGTISYYTTARCSGGAQVAGTSAGQIAVVTPLEQGGSYCSQN